MNAFAFSPPPTVAVPIVGTDKQFPVRRVYCVGRNYEEHAKEMGFTGREPPFFFFKPADAVVVVPAGQTGHIAYPSLTQNLHHEIELVVAIGKGGKNIPAERADEHIYGLTVMNDWSARALQMQEMQMSLGPAKGKDFATSLGPCLVSKEALKDRIITTPHGNQYDLPMTASINGETVSRGNVKDMHWTFAQIIERISYGVEIHPGEVIGSGTCGTGCLLELNGSKVFTPPRWLQVGDEVECAIEGIGTLKNRIKLAE